MFIENHNLALILASVEVFIAGMVGYTLVLHWTSYVERNWMDRVGYAGMTFFISINAFEKLIFLMDPQKPYYFGWKFGIIVFLALFLAGNLCSYRRTGVAILWKASQRRLVRT